LTFGAVGADSLATLKMRTAIYPGSFDPLTNGHLSLIQRSLKMFDHLVVAIATNPKKTSLFTVDERKAIIQHAVKDKRVEVDAFEGLLVDYARRRGIKVMIRGLRAVSDFEFEFQLANMNRKLRPDIETVFMMTGEDYFYISSNLVREVASLGGNVDDLVPPGVGKKLKAKFKGK
jgi:pantetheine-phosphate adenylyltransferase